MVRRDGTAPASPEHGTEVGIADDGVGMPAELTRSRVGHRGLSAMHDRASVAGGWLRVDARPGGGTSVTLWLPAGSDVP